MHRFYCPGSLTGPRIALTGSEAHHLARVLRLAAGEQVELFDGAGTAVTAQIAAVSKQRADLQVVGSPVLTPRPTPQIHLLVAAPKADRLRWLIEKAAELGVARVSLLQTAHSVVHPGEGKLDKLRATVIAACKQCNRNDLMPIDPPRPFHEVLDALPDREAPLLIATLDTPSIAMQLPRLHSQAAVTLAIGPEGDWSPDEIAHATGRGAIPVGLGPLVLRVETAALAAVSTLLLGTGDPAGG